MKNEPDQRHTFIFFKVQKNFKSVLYRNSYHYPGCSIRMIPVVVHRNSGLVDSGPVDSGLVDSGLVDSGLVDSGLVDCVSIHMAPLQINAMLSKCECLCRLLVMDRFEELKVMLITYQPIILVFRSVRQESQDAAALSDKAQLALPAS